MRITPATRSDFYRKSMRPTEKQLTMAVYAIRTMRESADVCPYVMRTAKFGAKVDCRFLVLESVLMNRTIEEVSDLIAAATEQKKEDVARLLQLYGFYDAADRAKEYSDIAHEYDAHRA